MKNSPESDRLAEKPVSQKVTPRPAKGAIDIDRLNIWAVVAFVLTSNLDECSPVPYYDTPVCTFDRVLPAEVEDKVRDQKGNSIFKSEYKDVTVVLVMEGEGKCLVSINFELTKTEEVGDGRRRDVWSEFYREYGTSVRHTLEIDEEKGILRHDFEVDADQDGEWEIRKGYSRKDIEGGDTEWVTDYSVRTMEH